MVREEFEVGSGNVFADLGFADAEEHLAKAGVVFETGELLQAREAVGRMLRGEFRQFSLEELRGFLLKLKRGGEVELRGRNWRRCVIYSACLKLFFSKDECACE